MDFAIPEGFPGLSDGLYEPALPELDGPPSQAEMFARLRLARSRRVGPATFRRLIAEHGCGIAALEALPGHAAKAGDTGYAPADDADIRREIKAAKAQGARLLALGVPGYPARLAQIPDAPAVLWAEGDTTRLGRRCVAIVGTRNASSLARRMARALGRDLAREGVVVVSGLARGVDAVAHEAALDPAHGGGTIAVHAGGLDRVYPAENVDLAARIAAQGLSLSERAFGLAPQARDFPRRNRIVSGLSQAVVVVEAAAKSGSMITARNALDQGREVLAVPGHPFDGRASGCNLLLRDGATLVRGVDDILDALDALAETPVPLRDAVDPERRPAPVPVEAGDLPRRVLDLLSPVPTPEDQLLRDLPGPVPAGVLAALLTELEVGGQIARRPGGGLVRL